MRRRDWVFGLVLVFFASCLCFTQMAYGHGENSETVKAEAQGTGEASFEGYVSAGGIDYTNSVYPGMVMIIHDGNMTTDVIEHLTFKNLDPNEVYLAQVNLTVDNKPYEQWPEFESRLLRIYKGKAEVLNSATGEVVETLDMDEKTGKVDLTFSHITLVQDNQYQVQGLLCKSPFGDGWEYQFEMPEDASKLTTIPGIDANLFWFAGQQPHAWSRVQVVAGKNAAYGSANKEATLYIYKKLHWFDEVNTADETEVWIRIYDTLFSSEYSYLDIPKGAEFTLTAQIVDITNGANEVVFEKELPYKYVPNSYLPDAMSQVDLGYFGEGFEPKMNHTYVLTGRLESKDEYELDDGTKQKIVVEHNDLTDPSQTFSIKRGYGHEETSLDTTAVIDDREADWDNPLELEIDSDFVYHDVKDRLQYIINAPGRKYVVIGKLFDKTDGNKLVAQNEFMFTPTTRYGEVDNVFSNVKLERDHEYVFTEQMLSLEKYPAYSIGIFMTYDKAVHEDLEDARQTIRVVGKSPEKPKSSIDTTVKVDHIEGSVDELQVLSITKKTEVADVEDLVVYKGLLADEPYTVSAELYDLTDEKTKDVQEQSITPTSSDGQTTMTFEQVELKAGHTYVVFETITSENTIQFADGPSKHIVEHKDKGDLKQSFKVVQMTIPELPATGSRYLPVLQICGFVLIAVSFAYRELVGKVRNS